MKNNHRKSCGTFLRNNEMLTMMGLVVCLVVITGCSDEAQNEVVMKQEIKPASYEIIKTEILSSAPKNKEMRYRIVVSSDIKENQIIPTLQKIVSDVTSEDRDIDEISFLLYSDENLVDGAYDVARAHWAYKGEFGAITPEITKSNVRDGYKIVIDDVKDNLEEYLKQREVVEEKFGLTEQERRSIYKEVVAVEDKGRKEGNLKYPTDINILIEEGLTKEQQSERILQNTDLTTGLQEKYRLSVLQKYNLTKDQWFKIMSEAISEGWASE